jgi:hypothetical protein
MHFVRWVNEVRGKGGVGDPEATKLVREMLDTAEADAAVKPTPRLARPPLDLTKIARGDVDKKTGVRAPHVVLKKVLVKGSAALADAVRDAKWEIRKDTHDHLRAVTRELVGRLRSLRYFEAVRDMQRRKGGDAARAGEAILSCCGHLGPLKKMQHHANLQVRRARAGRSPPLRRPPLSLARRAPLSCFVPPRPPPSARARRPPRRPMHRNPPATRTGVPRRGLQGARPALVRRRVRLPRRRLGGRAARRQAERAADARQRRQGAARLGQGRRDRGGQQGDRRPAAVRLQAARPRRAHPRPAQERAVPRLCAV